MTHHRAAAFPVGYHTLHPDVSINFQMNRFYNWVGEPLMLEELREAAGRIDTYEDLRHEVLALAEQALAAGRTLAGAYYLRLAEFFIFAEDPAKGTVRQRFLDLVRASYGIRASDRIGIPYQKARLWAYRFTAQRALGTLVIFGGFDSYLEEWFPMFEWLRDAGYDVIAFEGPGQGAVLEDERLAMTEAWDRPVRAVLDHFQVDDVTLIGLSLGGGLVVKAAAGEPRVRRVVAVDILADFLEVVLRQASPIVRAGVKLLLHLKAAGVVNMLVRAVMRRSRVIDWGVRQGMHVFGVRSPYAFFAAARRFNTRSASRQITQDCLLLAGADDHYVSVGQLHEQIGRLTRARSITARIFKAHESAQNHCQVGNLSLVLDVVVNWVQLTTRGASAAQ